jgi:SpoVK/Ycf46/Vps4 family AAA+-type ATPase
MNTRADPGCGSCRRANGRERHTATRISKCRHFAARRRGRVAADLSLSEEEAATLKAVSEAAADRVLLCAGKEDAAARLGGLAAIALEVPMPTPAERDAARAALTGAAATSEAAAKFRLGTEQIAKAAHMARVEAQIAGRDAPTPSDLDAGARHASRSALGDRAVRLPPAGEWADLVLPARQLEQLQSISVHLRHRDYVFTEWGFDRELSRRLGLSVLFAGESGTGKTMAARVLAADLGLELFAINLATVVSKFVGETEQNLERIFTAAEGSTAILLFDEADALFGRRSDVSDSQDRYANLEVAYLLQRVEAYIGAVILTNLKENLDPAFLRRLDFVVDFRFPDRADRRRLWGRALPGDAPVGGDIDFDFIADKFRLSGGSIRNCAVAAALEAASTDQPIRMAHIVRAIASEYGKLGRLTVESDFGPYSAMLRDPESPSIAEPPPAPPEPPSAQDRRVRIGSRIDEL